MSNLHDLHTRSSPSASLGLPGVAANNTSGVLNRWGLTACYQNCISWSSAFVSWTAADCCSLTQLSARVSPPCSSPAHCMQPTVVLHDIQPFFWSCADAVSFPYSLLLFPSPSQHAGGISANVLAAAAFRPALPVLRAAWTRRLAICLANCYCWYVS